MLKGTEKNAGLKAAVKDCCLFVLSMWGKLSVADDSTLLCAAHVQPMHVSSKSLGRTAVFMSTLKEVF